MRVTWCHFYKNYSDISLDLKIVPPFISPLHHNSTSSTNSEHIKMMSTPPSPFSLILLLISGPQGVHSPIEKWIRKMRSVLGIPNPAIKLKIEWYVIVEGKKTIQMVYSTLVNKDWMMVNVIIEVSTKNRLHRILGRTMNNARYASGNANAYPGLPMLRMRYLSLFVNAKISILQSTWLLYMYIQYTHFQNA